VLYFDKQEDALLFTLAASSVMSPEGPVQSSNAVVKVAAEISKASRITLNRSRRSGSPSQQPSRANPSARQAARRINNEISPLPHYS
jgi:hypothetical protein